jgi:hypothetical protein
MPHQNRIFVEDGALVYIHHDEGNPANDEPGKRIKLKPGKKIKFKSRDGNLTITFKTSSPFVSGRMVLTALVNRFTTLEEIKPFTPPPRNPSFAYTAQVGTISEDPEVIIDTEGGSGGSKKPAKKAKTKAGAKKKK